MSRHLYRTVPRFLGATLLASGVGAVASSCTTSATEIVAGTTTQIQVSKELKSIGVVIRFGGQLIRCQGYPLVDGTVTIPHTLGAVPQEGREGQVLEPVTITVLGFRTAEAGQFFDEHCLEDIPSPDTDPEVMVMRSRRMPYTVEEILYMPIPLRESCAGVACEDGTTCIGGVCEDNLISDEDIVQYSDALVFGDTNTCFNPAICLPKALTFPAILTDAETCTFRYQVPPIVEDGPAPTAGNLNVEIVYTSFGTEILDLDDQEGFVFPDRDDPFTFRLAENLCESNFKAGKIVGVYAAPTCPAKPALQPICSDALAGILAGERGPDALEKELCTLGAPLQASESALYVLLDRSRSMGELFGDPLGLQLAVGVPLRNPVAARTRLALSFLPADVTDCDNSSYVTPDIGFDDVEEARPPIIDALASPDTVLPDDPPMFLDAAMEGAYEALAALEPVETAGFNRKALIIVGNRDFQSHCPVPDGTPVDLAADALADQGIFTYAAVLDAPADAEQNGDNPQASAAAIAAAGGTEVFDAIDDDQDGLLAVQNVLNDLGSCVYDAPLVLIQNSATHLSYVDPIKLVRTDIARNDDCTGELTAQTVDGWSIEPDTKRVRICGQPCEDLRQTLSDTAAYFLLLQEPAPSVPVIASVDCDEPDRFNLADDQ